MHTTSQACNPWLANSEVFEYWQLYSQSEIFLQKCSQKLTFGKHLNILEHSTYSTNYSKNSVEKYSKSVNSNSNFFFFGQVVTHFVCF